MGDMVSIIRKLYDLETTYKNAQMVKVGFLNPNVKYPTKKGADAVSVPQVAWWNEVGSKGAENDRETGRRKDVGYSKYRHLRNFVKPNHSDVRRPARPFFKYMIEDTESKWGTWLQADLIRANGDAKKALTLSGARLANKIELSILASYKYLGLAKSTVARKRFDTPLIETALMLRSVKYVVT